MYFNANGPRLAILKDLPLFTTANSAHGTSSRSVYGKQLFLAMRITTILLLSASLSASAAASAQHVTLSEKNVRIEKVFREIRKQTGYVFFYDKHLLLDVPSINVDVKNASVEQTLEDIFQGQPLAFAIEQKTITIFRKKIIEKPKEVDLPDVPYTIITGTVKDEKGYPLAGAGISLKGTKKGTITKTDGSFSIDANVGDVLEFSFIGYNNKEITVGSSDHLSVVLQIAEKAENDVVVVGYGTQKKVNLTGSVEVIKGKELVNRPTSTLSQALQGKVAGLNFTPGTYGFEPGAALGIQIRGQGSPLVIVDGVATTNLNGINPNDIASISVLKDAAASAIYGARAPYGVILITTKSGSVNGKLSINYAGNYSSIRPYNMPRMPDSYTTALAYNEASANTGTAHLYTDQTIDRILAYQADPKNTPETVPDPTNPTLWANTNTSNANYDWFNVFYGHGIRYQHNLSLSGGNKGFNFYLSGGYDKDGGVLQYGKDNYDRYNAIAKLEANLTDWIKFSSNTRYYNTSRNTPSYDNQGNYELLFHQVARTLPSQYMISPTGAYSVQSKIPWTRDAGNTNLTNYDIVQRFATEIKPLRNWTINADYTFDMTNTQNTVQNFTVYEDNVAGEPVISGSTADPSVSEANTWNFYKSFNLYSTYKWALEDKHHFALTAGYQTENSSQTYLQASKDGLITSSVPSLSTATGVITASDALTAYATQGVFGRFNYDYNGKYLFEFDSRYDGTYKFADGKKFGFFPSASAGWNISKETFFDNLRPVINELKIRGSYGSLGNQSTAAAYQDIPLLGVNANLNWMMNGVRPSYTTAPNLINPDVTWETSSTADIGIDLGVLSNRLTFTGDVYQRKTTNQLGPQEAVPAVIGVSTLPNANNEETKTNGWELLIKYRDQIGKDFHYSVAASLFDFQSTVTKYNNPTKILTNPYAGQKVGEIWGLVSNNLIPDQKTADNINQNKIQNAISGQTWNTGDVQYSDINGDGVVNYGANTVTNPGDQRIIGNETSRYQFGLTLTAEWKGFDFSMFWQGVGKRDLWLTGNFMWGFVSAAQSSIFLQHLNYYRDADATKYAGLGPNTNAYYARPYLKSALNDKNEVTQTRYLQNGAYARLKNVQLGYHLPPSVLQKMKLQNIYVYVSGENLATITSLLGQFDPENANIGARGNGKSFFPQQAYTFGLNIQF
jgi:TonB-linked SusC/RagA family outer membrane protein